MPSIPSGSGVIGVEALFELSDPTQTVWSDWSDWTEATTLDKQFSEWSDWVEIQLGLATRFYFGSNPIAGVRLGQVPVAVGSS